MNERYLENAQQRMGVIDHSPNVNQRKPADSKNRKSDFIETSPRVKRLLILQAFPSSPLFVGRTIDRSRDRVTRDRVFFQRNFACG